METLQKNIAECETEVQSYSTEVAELKRTYQTLQITRQSLQAEVEITGPFSVLCFIQIHHDTDEVILSSHHSHNILPVCPADAVPAE